jgi:hypothetical protein
MNLKTLSAGVVAMACCAAAPLAAHAQWWSQHPAYLHAMANLRTAYWLEAHREPAGPAQSADERKALNEIRVAYQELKDASLVDDKDINDQPPANFDFGDHGGRLHRALDLLRDAHDQIAKEEDNPAARGLRDRAAHHIDDAGRATAAAIHAWHF